MVSMHLDDVGFRALVVSLVSVHSSQCVLTSQDCLHSFNGDLKKSDTTTTINQSFEPSSSAPLSKDLLLFRWNIPLRKVSQDRLRSDFNHVNDLNPFFHLFFADMGC